jgi:hypothetical protein
VDFALIQRKPQLCRPFLAIPFSELVLSPHALSKFLPSRFEETVTPLWRLLSVFRHGLSGLLMPQPRAKLEPQKGLVP